MGKTVTLAIVDESWPHQKIYTIGEDAYDFGRKEYSKILNIELVTIMPYTPHWYIQMENGRSISFEADKRFIEILEKDNGNRD